MKISSGVSMGSKVKNTKGKEYYANRKKKDKEKLERAKICIDCVKNNEGFCNKHREWCFKVNYICLGIKNPYEYIPPKAKVSKKKVPTEERIKSYKENLADKTISTTKRKWRYELQSTRHEQWRVNKRARSYTPILLWLQRVCKK